MADIFLKNKIPSKITVTGSNNTSVNGTFSRITDSPTGFARWANDTPSGYLIQTDSPKTFNLVGGALTSGIGYGDSGNLGVANPFGRLEEFEISGATTLTGINQVYRQNAGNPTGGATKWLGVSDSDYAVESVGGEYGIRFSGSEEDTNIALNLGDVSNDLVPYASPNNILFSQGGAGYGNMTISNYKFFMHFRPITSLDLRAKFTNRKDLASHPAVGYTGRYISDPSEVGRGFTTTNSSTLRSIVDSSLNGGANLNIADGYGTAYSTGESSTFATVETSLGAPAGSIIGYWVLDESNEDGSECWYPIGSPAETNPGIWPSGIIPPHGFTTKGYWLKTSYSDEEGSSLNTLSRPEVWFECVSTLNGNTTDNFKFPKSFENHQSVGSDKLNTPSTNDNNVILGRESTDSPTWKIFRQFPADNLNNLYTCDVTALSGEVPPEGSSNWSIAAAGGRNETVSGSITLSGYARTPVSETIDYRGGKGIIAIQGNFGSPASVDIKASFDGGTTFTAIRDINDCPLSGLSTTQIRNIDLGQVKLRCEASSLSGAATKIIIF